MPTHKTTRYSYKGALARPLRDDQLPDLASRQLEIAERSDPDVTLEVPIDDDQGLTYTLNELKAEAQEDANPRN